MHILVVNDDGPPCPQSSPYVLTFVRHLQAAGHTVSVILPHTQRSWIGKAHIVGALVKPTYYRPPPPSAAHSAQGTTHAYPGPGEEWVLVDSTPASCVQIGLHHFFADKGPIDLVVSGPNYGRNSTAVFSLSSGTLGGALEGAICRKRSIAVSYAFFNRNHDPVIIAAASRQSVKLIEYLMQNWGEGVDLYSVNVPLIADVETRKILWTHMLQNYWSSGSSFQEVQVQEEESPAEQEHDIREREGTEGDAPNDANEEVGRARHKHKHFKWAPRFVDVHKSVQESEPGNDGWAVQEGYTSITPLKANFMHVPGYQGELTLYPLDGKNTGRLHALIDPQDPYIHPLLLSALNKHLPNVKFISSLSELPTAETPVLQYTSYETINFDHVLAHPASSLANAYVIRKALIRKHYLATTVQNWLSKQPGSILKQHFKPTLELELDYAEFLDEALVEAWELREAFERNEHKEPEQREWWILKPGMTDRGQGIRLFSSEEELREIFQGWEDALPDSEESDDEAEAESHGEEDADAINMIGNGTITTLPRRTDSPIIISQLRHFIVQPYIDPPLLLPSNSRKFHIRAYILVVGSLRVYVYRDMLALLAAAEYQSPSSTATPNLGAHLTNTCLQDGSRDGSVQRFWSLDDADAGWKESVWGQICKVTGQTLEAAARGMMVHFQTLPNAFELFGLDFLVDAHMNAWLLEVNAFPDFAQTGDELKGVVAGLFSDVVQVAVKPFFGLDLRGEQGTPTMERVLDIDLGRR